MPNPCHFFAFSQASQSNERRPLIPRPPLTLEELNQQEAYRESIGVLACLIFCGVPITIATVYSIADILISYHQMTLGLMDNYPECFNDNLLIYSKSCAVPDNLMLEAKQEAGDWLKWHFLPLLGLSAALGLFIFLLYICLMRRCCPREEIDLQRSNQPSLP